MLILKISVTLLAVLHALACQTHITFGYSGCVFQVSYPDSACYNFNFQQWQWTQCISYYTDDQGDSQCAQYQTYTDPNWDSCTQRCCDESVTYPQNSDSISQCQDYLNSRFRRIMAIVFGIIGGIALLFIILCCCCGGCGCCENCQCDSCSQILSDCCDSFWDKLHYLCTCKCFRRRDQDREDGQNQARREPYTIEMINPGLESRAWQYEGLRNSHLANICSVCLQNKPFLELQCGHIYHPKCIVACMRRKQECVLCRSTRFNQVKVYCQTCFASFYSTTFLDNMDKLEQKQECGGCQEAHLFTVMKE